MIDSETIRRLMQEALEQQAQQLLEDAYNRQPVLTWMQHSPTWGPDTPVVVVEGSVARVIDEPTRLLAGPVQEGGKV